MLIKTRAERLHYAVFGPEHAYANLICQNVQEQAVNELQSLLSLIMSRICKVRRPADRQPDGGLCEHLDQWRQHSPLKAPGEAAVRVSSKVI